MQKHTSIFVLGLIGSILGILGSLSWFGTGTQFWSGFYDGFNGYDYYTSYSTSSIVFGLYIGIIQGLITLAAFILSLIKSTPSNLQKNLHNSGIWLLVLGITTLVINISLIIPSVLVIIAGAIALSRSKNTPEKEEKLIEPAISKTETTVNPEQE